MDISKLSMEIIRLYLALSTLIQVRDILPDVGIVL